MCGSLHETISTGCTLPTPLNNMYAVHSQVCAAASHTLEECGPVVSLSCRMGVPLGNDLRRIKALLLSTISLLGGSSSNALQGWWGWGIRQPLQRSVVRGKVGLLAVTHTPVHMHVCTLLHASLG